MRMSARHSWMSVPDTHLGPMMRVITVLEAYRKHIEERAALGIVPQPLNAEQTAGLVELLKNPPAGEEEFLVDLITNRIPPGVDEAAYVKAGFLAAIGAWKHLDAERIAREKERDAELERKRLETERLKAAGEKKVGPIRQWIKDHPNIWEFILFNVLSNISTITRFVVTWIGTAIFISGLGLTQPFHFLIFNYDTKGNGLGGFLTFLLAEVLAQVVNFFVQMKWVFKSDSSFKDAAWKYVILAVIIVVVNLVLPGYVTGLCQGWGMNAGIAGTIASVVNTLLAVIVSYPLLKFWVMPKSDDKKEAAK